MRHNAESLKMRLYRLSRVGDMKRLIKPGGAKGGAPAPKRGTNLSAVCMAKAGSLKLEIVKQCLQLLLIASLLTGADSVHKLVTTVARLIETVRSFSAVLDVKGYPSLPMVLPDLDDYSSMDSVKDTSQKRKSLPPGSNRK